MESNRFIVCIDDEFFILWNLKEQLKKVFGSKFRIETADSAASAEEIIQDISATGGDLAVVICDQVMPGKNGDEFLIELHKSYPKTKKIILTGQAPAQAIGNALNHGCLYRFLPKPWDSHDLELTIKQAIDAFYQEKTLEEKNAKLEQSLFFNANTNYPNLESLTRKLNQETEKPHSIVLIKIQNYNTLLRNFGIDVINSVIKELLQILSNQLNPTDTIFHTYENEFAIVSDPQEEVLKHLIDSFQSQVASNSIFVDGVGFYLVYLYSLTTGMEDIYNQAKLALMLAEEDTTEHFIRYSKTTHTLLFSQNLQLARRIKNAMEEHRFVPFFQGILNNQSKEFEKFECLVRLKENNNFLQPSDFLNLANITGMIRDIDREMIQESMRFFSDKPFQFSLNISETLLNEESFSSWLEEKLFQFKIPAKQLTLEINESNFLWKNERIKSRIKDLKSIGCQISLDKFGDRYSELNHILELNPDSIKIDVNSIIGLTKNRSAILFVKGLVEITRDAGVKLIANHVDKSEIQSTVESLGIEYSQGYLFMEPLPGIPIH